MKSDPLVERLARVEARLAALEAGAARGPSASAVPGPAPRVPAQAGAGAGGEDPLWVLEGLRRRLPAQQGAVVYAGRYCDPAGGELHWQIGQAQQALLGEDCSELAPRLAALGSAVRLRLLQALLQGVTAVAELAARPGMGTRGQLYHHLRELEAAGWLHAPQRGCYAVRQERVVALMAVLTAARR